MCETCLRQKPHSLDMKDAWMRGWCGRGDGGWRGGGDRTHSHHSSCRRFLYFQMAKSKAPPTSVCCDGRSQSSITAVCQRVTDRTHQSVRKFTAHCHGRITGAPISRSIKIMSNRFPLFFVLSKFTLVPISHIRNWARTQNLLLGRNAPHPLGNTSHPNVTQGSKKN